jgi:hypothetical protein
MVVENEKFIFHPGVAMPRPTPMRPVAVLSTKPTSSKRQVNKAPLAPTE